MNRDIKFRAWDKKRNEMRPVYTINNLDDDDDSEYKYICSNQNSAGEGIIEWKDVVLMQYTGLKDVKKTDIYEDDIVAFPYMTPFGDVGDREDTYSYYGKVIYEGGVYLVEPIKSDEGFSNKRLLRDVVKSKGYIIGNIHTNPELLE